MPSPPGTKATGATPSCSEAGSEAPLKRKLREKDLLDKSMTSLVGLTSSDEDAQEINVAEKRNIKKRRTAQESGGLDPLEQLTRLAADLDALMSNQRGKLTSSGANRIREMMAEQRLICMRLVKENAYLTGKLDERTSSASILDEIKDCQEKIVKQVMAPISYAGMAAKSAPAPVKVQGKINTVPRHDRRTVLMYPKDKSESNSSLATEALVKMCINPQTMGLRIKRMTKIRNNGVAIEVLDDASLEKLKTEPKLRVVVEMAQPKKRQPKVLIYDVPVEIKDSELAKKLQTQNADLPQGDEICNEFRPLFKTGPRNQPVTNWVVEVSPRVRNALLRSGRAFLGWTSCRVVDHHIVSRCYKCQRFGHMAKACTAKEDTCGHCAATGHDSKACPDKDNKAKIKCANCAHVAKGKTHPANHSASDRKCPTYLAEIERLIAQTDYGC